MSVATIYTNAKNNNKGINSRYHKNDNIFPVKDGGSKTMSPGTIVDDIQTFYMSVKKINFGSFAYIQIGTTNTMQSRILPVIALILSNNNGGHYF